MLNKQRRFRIVILFVLFGISLATFYLLTQPISIESFMNRSVIMVALISLGLVGVAVFELNTPRSIRISKHYSLFGPGYGFLTVLKHITQEMEQLRIKQEAGEVSDDDLERLEENVMNKLQSFVSDQRWKDVLSLKKAENEEDAKALARIIREDAGVK